MNPNCITVAGEAKLGLPGLGYLGGVGQSGAGEGLGAPVMGSSVVMPMLLPSPPAATRAGEAAIRTTVHRCSEGCFVTHVADSHGHECEKRGVAIRGKYCSCGLEIYLLQNITF